MQDLLNEVSRNLDKLDELVADLRVTGRELAEVESDYRIAEAVTALKMRDAGYPMTLIDKTLKGDPDVVGKRRLRDCKAVEHKATLEAINAAKLRIKIINEQASMEWGR